MEQKIKFILIGLVAILAVSLFIALQSYTAKQGLEKERDALKTENATLSKEAEDNLQENKRLTERMNLLNQDLDRVGKEKEELQNKFDLVFKERDALIEKLKKETRAAKEQEIQAPQAAVAEDNYWAGILKSKTNLELQLEGVRAELKNLQINSEQVGQEKNNLELEVTNLHRENTDIKRQLDYNKKVMDSIAQELVRERNDKFQIENTFKEIKAENLILRRQLKSLGKRKINLEKKLAQLQTKNTDLENRFTEMDTLLKGQTSQIGGLKTQLETAPDAQAAIAPAKEGESAVELAPIVVRPKDQVSTATTAPLSVSGKVIALNKENNFVIIDLGLEAGLKLGDTFQVYRDAGPIANIEVIQLRTSIAACDIKKQTRDIEIGDTIR
ncbi:MAG: hypothetical protein HZC16_02730 [Candidatus Omnitrophica bacterium]|nr:hypothetical protein [Candidatus Omnitrophota bacterium]